jgi:hypothetical protein
MTILPNTLILYVMHKLYKRPSQQKKHQQLQMSPTNARTILFKTIIRQYFARELGAPYCFRCGEEIHGLNFHVDHMVPWLDSESPHALYFDIENLSLSHALCNSISSRRYKVSDEHRERVKEEARQRYRAKKVAK